MKRSYWLIGAIAAVVLLALWAFSGYNSLVTERQNVDTAWSNVETVYQRRFDLIPNLVNTVKGAAGFEQDTLIAVTEARTQWQNAGSRDERVDAANDFDGALSRLLVTVEAYPQLQATQAFRDLMTQLEGTENRISTERRDYNEAVRTYNLAVKRFPGAILAGAFGFDAEPGFEATEGSENAPSVNFDQ
jgi:LemA protein